MARKSWISGGLPGLLLTVVLGVSPAAGGAVLDGSYWYVVDHITRVEQDGRILLWVALPPDRPEQVVTVTNIVPEPVAILVDEASGNRIIEWTAEPAGGVESSAVLFHFDFQLEQLPRFSEIEAAEVLPYDRTDPHYLKYTGPETWIQTDGAILDQARSIIGEETNPWLMANLIFDWTRNNLTFVPGGFGERDAVSTLLARQGDCGQFSCLFTALCRSVGIPARTVANVWTDGGAHISAEILLTGLGWLPMDTSLGQMLLPGGGGLSPEEVKSFLSVRGIPLTDPAWLAGNLYDNRLTTSVGNNLRFQSPTLDRQVTFQQMNPGGADAFPEAIQLTGLNRDIIHGGFFVFGRTLLDQQEAHELAHQRLARSYFREGLYDMAEDVCRKAQNLAPDEVQSWVNQGKAYLHKGEYYKAEAAFKRALAAAPQSSRDQAEIVAWTHNYLGNCYDLLGHRTMALQEYQIVVGMANNYRGAVDYARKYLLKEFNKATPDKK